MVYPPRCGGCGKFGVRWCDECASSVRVLSGPVCQVCGLPLDPNQLCPDCSKFGKREFQLRSWAAYEGPLREAIHRIKYKQDIGLAENFVQYMLKGIDSLGWRFDMVIPVPLNQKRRKERGYNQSALLAWPIAAKLRCKYRPNDLMRNRNTITQTRLDADARRMNVKGAFEAKSKCIQGKSILLVDDLATTCSTIEACTEALLRAGADRVYAYTLARTL